MNKSISKLLPGIMIVVVASCQTDTGFKPPVNPCHREALKASEQMHSQINRVRRKAGQPELLLDSVLIAIAGNYARQMALREEVSHEDQYGRGPMERMARQGQVREQVAENIARIPDQQNFIFAFLKDWWQKPKEKSNILSPKYYRMGSGYYANKGQCYGVILFTD